MCNKFKGDDNVTKFMEYYTKEDVIKSVDFAAATKSISMTSLSEFYHVAEYGNNRFPAILKKALDIFCEMNSYIGLELGNVQTERELTNLMLNYCYSYSGYRGDVRFLFIPMLCYLNDRPLGEVALLAQRCGGTVDSYIGKTIGILNIFLAVSEPFSNTYSLVPIYEQQINSFQNSAIKIKSTVHGLYL